MIDWKVKTGSELSSKEGWCFSSFPIQQYLLPIINVGSDYIDEYSEHKFIKDDCIRIKANISCFLGSEYFINKEAIKFDSFPNGIVTLDKNEIENNLNRLSEAADCAAKENGVLYFYGD